MNTPAFSAASVRLSFSLPISTGLSLTKTVAIFQSLVLLYHRQQFFGRDVACRAPGVHDPVLAEVVRVVLIGHNSRSHIETNRVVLLLNRLSNLRGLTLQTVHEILELGGWPHSSAKRLIKQADLPQFVETLGAVDPGAEAAALLADLLANELLL